jgi:predicted nucleic acid-binding protein
VVVGFLADTSVLHRVGRSPEIARRIVALRDADQLWTCDIVSLELGHSARSQAECLGIQCVQSGLQQAPVTGEVMARALQAQGAMTATGKHRRQGQ